MLLLYTRGRLSDALNTVQYGIRNEVLRFFFFHEENVAMVYGSKKSRDELGTYFCGDTRGTSEIQRPKMIQFSE